MAAAERFAECGYHRTSLRDVLADTSLTKGALYHHFGSKLALAQAVCATADESWNQVIATISERGLDPLQELLVRSDATLRQFTHELTLTAALRICGEAEELAGQLGDWRGQWEDRTTALLARALGDGLLRPGVRPDALGRHLVALMLGHVMYAGPLTTAGFDIRARLDESWDDVLGVVATSRWLRDWRASGWHRRNG